MRVGLLSLDWRRFRVDGRRNGCERRISNRIARRGLRRRASALPDASGCHERRFLHCGSAGPSPSLEFANAAMAAFRCCRKRLLVQLRSWGAVVRRRARVKPAAGCASVGVGQPTSGGTASSEWRAAGVHRWSMATDTSACPLRAGRRRTRSPAIRQSGRLRGVCWYSRQAFRRGAVSSRMRVQVGLRWSCERSSSRCGGRPMKSAKTSMNRSLRNRSASACSVVKGMCGIRFGNSSPAAQCSSHW